MVVLDLFPNQKHFFREEDHLIRYRDRIWFFILVEYVDLPLVTTLVKELLLLFFFRGEQRRSRENTPNQQIRSFKNEGEYAEHRRSDLCSSSSSADPFWIWSCFIFVYYDRKNNNTSDCSVPPIDVLFATVSCASCAEPQN